MEVASMEVADIQAGVNERIQERNGNGVPSAFRSDRTLFADREIEFAFQWMQQKIDFVQQQDPSPPRADYLLEHCRAFVHLQQCRGEVVQLL
jgi:hypothetical protein